MDAGVDSTALPIQGPRTRQRPPPATKGSSRSPVTPRDGGVGSARSRHTATVSTRSGGERRGAARGAKSKARLLPGTVAKSLLPATERRSHEDYPLRKPSAKKGSDERWEIAPDGGSAGREGRHFTVANVGNNGRIYLRPTVRPANQRYPQPHFVFPITPPGTAGLDGLATVKTTRGIEDLGQTNGTQWTPSQAPSTPIDQLQAPPNGIRLPTGHRRAVSDSTIRDASVARESEPGAFKIVITQPGEETRLRTVEDRIDPASSPLLEVAIPSWKIGTPRFTLQGTPFFRGSSYAPTEDFHSSHHSLLNPSRSRTPRTGSIMSRRPTPIEVPQEQLPAHADPNSLSALSSARLPLQNMLRSTYLSGHLVIEPTMFDALTFKPACDDRAIVRYSPATGAVTAATPPRLVAEITSPSFLDYELLSDFFLTFRAFLEPSDLLHMLIARLRWALARDDETGMVVRVRTFVALRHWILNYFVDDFVIDYQLRLTFCNLLNDFVEELSQDTRGGKVQLKILAELKKCWRRVCAQYWDGPEFDSSLELEAPIAPGGLAGHRSTSLDPRFWEKFEEGPLHLDAVLSQSRSQDEAATASCQNTSKVGRIDSVLMGHQRPGTPEEPGGAEERLERRQASSPTSITSLDVTSCSFPTRNLRLAHLGSSYPLAPHPVDPSSVYANAGPVATTPKALVGKRVRPHQSHKRNGSLTDSLREHPTTQDKSTFYKNAELILTLPYAGSLVRGNLLPPGQALVEVLSPNTPGAPSRQTTVFQPHPTDARKDKGLASGMSGPGMRRLLGSVRRALSTRGQGVSPTQGNFISISPIGPRGATTNRLPGTAIVPQARPRVAGMRSPVRIDLLGAEIAEDFKTAVREDAAAYVEQRGLHQSIASATPITGIAAEPEERSPAHIELVAEERVHRGDDRRPFSDGDITTGSKSIVIVDDTVPLPASLPSMAGALPAVNSSVEAFAETVVPHLAGPTPPNTPPGQSRGTPRRSSHILGDRHIVRPSLSADQLPPFVPDLNTLGMAGPVGRASGFGRPSGELTRQSSSRPPLSAGNGHMRRPSSRSYRSLGYRRYASFHSGMVPQPTIRSFDATTYSEGSVMDDMSEIPMPQPLRVLRRRPGGDLRAVAKVGELDQSTLRRSRSVGSLTTYTDSFRSSFLRSPATAQESSGFVDVVNSDYSREGVDTFSLGAITEQRPKQQISLFSTHSSKPVMRPSFEAEAQKLAQIPDDADDDGGVESALLKLEGKYEKRSPKLLMEPTRVPPKISSAADLSTLGQEDFKEKKKHRHEHVGDEGVSIPLTAPSENTPVESFLTVPSNTKPPNDEARSFLSDDSTGSYSSIPLLQRGLTDEGRRSKAEWTNHSILQGPEEGASTSGALSEKDSEHSSYEFVRKTKSMEKIEHGAALPGSAGSDEKQSFFNDDSDEEGELSSELSEECVEEDFYDSDSQVAFPPVRADTVISRLAAGSLGEAQGIAEARDGPPSPPITLTQALAMYPETAGTPEVHDHQLWDDKPLPPTPETTPTTAQYAPSMTSPGGLTGTEEALRNAHRMAEQQGPRSFSVHLPFILAFDSEVLAQQFTLIEKDALNEIDWKELIEMRWKNADNIDSRSWVDFLRNTEAHGVEVVIARFNIMVKWAVSEIVLTQDLEERARCTIKLIHIAAHCRRYRNFATMSQIAIALSSNEITRLTKTWSFVPPTDMRTLRDLESLVSPTRNFYNLRAEMEGADIASADMGCIPFVGIYTHDLIFNAQRPSEIASSPTTAPLVNFERCRIAASIVKTLLRLLEASTLYTFQPVEGITERCLWMSALKDDDIRRRSESLE